MNQSTPANKDLSLWQCLLRLLVAALWSLRSVGGMEGLVIREGSPVKTALWTAFSVIAFLLAPFWVAGTIIRAGVFGWQRH